MSEIKDGWRSILSVPIIYNFFQRMMGGEGPAGFVNQFMKPKKGDRILDLGCGTARILDFLPKVDYVGFDSDSNYINFAKNKYGDLGTFYLGHVQQASIEKMLPFDIVIMMGVLHHLDDENVKSVLQIIYGALKPGGRLITIDPVFIRNQNLIAKILISLDRGRNVRTSDQYESLTRLFFTKSDVSIKKNTFIPYTHCIVECKK